MSASALEGKGQSEQVITELVDRVNTAKEVVFEVAEEGFAMRTAKLTGEAVFQVSVMGGDVGGWGRGLTILDRRV